MKSVLFGIVAMVVISAVAGGILLSTESSSQGTFSSLNGSVRLSE